MFDSKESATKGEPPLFLIPFSGVDGVSTIKIQGKQCTIIALRDGKTFIFATSNNKQLLGYCNLLYKLPDHAIPEIPKGHLVSQQNMEQYNDPVKYGASKSYMYFTYMYVAI